METITAGDQEIAVTTWCARGATTYHDRVWTAWLHGTVAAIHDAGGRLLLLVPVATLTPAAAAFALRLYRVGSYTVLD